MDLSSIPLAMVLFCPVKSDVTGQDPSLKHERLGKPGNLWDASLTALYFRLGTCSKAGHSWGLRTGHATACMEVEYWTPHTL